MTDPALRQRRSVRAGWRIAALLTSLSLLGACSGGAPILANKPALHPERTAAPSPPPRPADPQPVVFPRDDGPHDRLTEWWYYTGHLVAKDGRRFGFEFVVFRAERGGFPVSWASHLALTDESAGRFRYAQRSTVGAQVDHSPGSGGAPVGFALTLAQTGIAAVPGGPIPSAVPPPSSLGLPTPPSATTPWSMVGTAQGDRLIAAASTDEVANGGGAFGIDLSLARGPALLHDVDGFVGFGPAGGSYYYSRPREPVVRGTVSVAGQTIAVQGQAWFDHQWGDFIAVGGGWDWFAINLSDGRAITLSLVRDSSGKPALVYGTMLAGQTVALTQADFSVETTGHWQSPRTGAEYPAGWTISLPKVSLTVVLQPSVADQELDTRPTSGVVYWEGSQLVTVHERSPGSASGGSAPGGSGSRTGGSPPLTAEAYVELTGYPPSTPVRSSPSP